MTQADKNRTNRMLEILKEHEDLKKIFNTIFNKLKKEETLLDEFHIKKCELNSEKTAMQFEVIGNVYILEYSIVQEKGQNHLIGKIKLFKIKNDIDNVIGKKKKSPLNTEPNKVNIWFDEEGLYLNGHRNKAYEINKYMPRQLLIKIMSLIFLKEGYLED